MKLIASFFLVIGLAVGVSVIVAEDKAEAWPQWCTAGRSDTWSNDGAQAACGTNALGTLHRVILQCENNSGKYWRYGPWKAQGTGWSIARCNNRYWDNSRAIWFNVQTG